MTTTTSSTLSKVNVICIPQNDLDRAVAFYTETLGFEKRVDVPMGDDYRWVEVAPAGAETTIALAPPPPGAKVGGMETGIVFATGDVEAAHAELKAKGVDVDAEISRMGDPVPPMFWLRDPEANVLMVAQTDA